MENQLNIPFEQAVKVCKYCGKEFTDSVMRVYCSEDCRYKSRLNMYNSEQRRAINKRYIDKQRVKRHEKKQTVVDMLNVSLKDYNKCLICGVHLPSNKQFYCSNQHRRFVYNAERDNRAFPININSKTIVYIKKYKSDEILKIRRKFEVSLTTIAKVYTETKHPFGRHMPQHKYGDPLFPDSLLLIDTVNL